MIENIRSLTELLLFCEQGKVPPLLFFWGHTPREINKTDKSCLSNWFPACFTYNGINFKTAEHYMMAEKAILFQDMVQLEKILASETPLEAKKWGRKVTNFNPETWDHQAFEIVVQGNFAKFSQNPKLKSFLIGTGNQILVEAAPNDNIWGIGLASKDKRVHHPKTWLGSNLLGFALMEVRQRLLSFS